jgi:hypothetical protein
MKIHFFSICTIDPNNFGQIDNQRLFWCCSKEFIIMKRLLVFFRTWMSSSLGDADVAGLPYL